MSDLALVDTCHGLVIVASEYTKGIYAPQIRGASAGATEGVFTLSAQTTLVPRPGLQIHR